MNSSFNRFAFRGASALALIAGITSAASSCSVCIAHALGASLHGIGAQVLEKKHVVLGFSGLGFDKSNGSDSSPGLEHERYRQVSLDAFYGLSNQVMLRASLPYVTKRISTDGAGAESSQGLGDASVGFTYQLPPGTYKNALIAFTGDIKLPTGTNSARDSGGTLKEQHLQVGTGSTDFQIGVNLTTEAGVGGLVFGGLGARVNGHNSRDYHYGNALFYNIGYSRSIAPQTLGVIEFNGRVVGKDRVEDGSLDGESGGSLAYLSFSVRRSLGQGFGLIVGVQKPIWSHLNGRQTEGALISFSIGRSF